MIKIIIEYRQTASTIILGREQYDDIEQALIPRITGNATFCHRQFAGHPAQQWRVDTVQRTSVPGVLPVVVMVELCPHSTEKLEYLSATLDRITGSVSFLIKPGTLVEVDYGFVQEVIDDQGNTLQNKRYVDAHLSGEMNKRRLAVVTKVYKDTLQVVPITSKQGSPGDPTRALISQNTLRQLYFYGSSGLQSWALGGLIELVSFHRILPPALMHATKGIARVPTYTSRISTAERRMLMEAVAQGAGIDDYEKVKNELVTAKQDLVTSQADVQLLQTQLATLSRENARLKLVEEVAKKWQNLNHCRDLEEEVVFLEELYASEVVVTPS